MREELSEYLDGLQEQMPLAFWKLAEIFKYQVFELCEEPEEKEEESGKSYLIPYMMNDAIEDYLVLENCRMVGEVAAEEQAGGLELSARISGKEGAYVLVVRQKSLRMYGAVCGDGTGSRIFGTASFVPQISIEISGTVADKSADGSKQRATLRNHLTGSGSRVRYL